MDAGTRRCFRTAALCLFLVVSPGLAWPQEEPGAAHFLPHPPTSMELCGETVPLNLPFVAEQLDREFTIMVHDHAQVVLWLKRTGRYFPFIEKRLRRAGLPDDLKYLAVAESSLIYRVRSTAGAVGVWQFIPGTARRYGLRVNRRWDDRRDPVKATAAALAYLRDLHREFGSWTLAMAAYNSGEKRVARAIKGQGIRDYYHLHLPLETMRYIFRILAAKVILQDPERYGYVLPPERRYLPQAADKAIIKLSRPLHLTYAAQAAQTTYRKLRELNPALRNHYLPPGSHLIRVPRGQAKHLAARLKKIKPRPMPAPSATYTVKRGDTLSGIARRHRVRITTLQRANRMRSSFIKPGMKLIIPRK